MDTGSDIMSQELMIEKINLNNFEAFLELVEKLANYEKLTPPDDEAKSRLEKDGLSENPKYIAYLGKLDDKYVAYVIYFFNYSSFAARPLMYIEDIYVLDEYRRQGIGSKMFKFCVQQAKEHDCGRIEWCVLNWNEPGIKFYGKNDAQKLDWTFFRFDQDQINSFS
jgi:GNAT superfamily N-acetyltransferase